MKGIVRRKRKPKGGFLVGAVMGVAAGVAGGMALLRRAAAQDHGEATVAPPVTGAAEQAVHRVASVQAEGTARARGTLDALKERWRVAVQEGRVAAKERERELEAQYAFETKRIPPLDVKAIESIEAMMERRDDEGVKRAER